MVNMWAQDEPEWVANNLRLATTQLPRGKNAARFAHYLIRVSSVNATICHDLFWHMYMRHIDSYQIRHFCRLASTVLHNQGNVLLNRVTLFAESEVPNEVENHEKIERWWMRKVIEQSF